VRYSLIVAVVLAGACTLDWDKLDPANVTDGTTTTSTSMGGGGSGGEPKGGDGGTAGGGGNTAGGAGGQGGVGGMPPLGPWGTPALVASLVHVEDDDDPTATADGLQLFFNSGRDGEDKVWRATRSSMADDWGSPSAVDVLGINITNPTVSPDGLTIWFETNRDALGYFEIWVATRLSTMVEFDAPARADDLNVGGEGSGEVSGAKDDGLLLLTSRSNTFNERSRSSTLDMWGPEMATMGLNAPAEEEQEPFLSADGLVVYFSSDRLDVGANHDLFRAERTSVSTSWSIPEKVEGLPDGPHYTDPWVSPNERYMMFSRHTTAGPREIWETRR
jgi:hypothetical protein